MGSARLAQGFYGRRHPQPIHGKLPGIVRVPNSFGGNGGNGGAATTADAGTEHSETADEAAVKAVFDRFDVDHSGTIDKSELGAIIASLLHGTRVKKDVFESYLDQQFMQADRDFSGSIDYSEFSKLYRGLLPLLASAAASSSSSPPALRLDGNGDRSGSGSSVVIAPPPVDGKQTTLLEPIGEKNAPQTFVPANSPELPATALSSASLGLLNVSTKQMPQQQQQQPSQLAASTREKGLLSLPSVAQQQPPSQPPMHNTMSSQKNGVPPPMPPPDATVEKRRVGPSRMVKVKTDSGTRTWEIAVSSSETVEEVIARIDQEFLEQGECVDKVFVWDTGPQSDRRLVRRQHMASNFFVVFGSSGIIFTRKAGSFVAQQASGLDFVS